MGETVEQLQLGLACSGCGGRLCRLLRRLLLLLRVGCTTLGAVFVAHGGVGEVHGGKSVRHQLSKLASHWQAVWSHYHFHTFLVAIFIANVAAASWRDSVGPGLRLRSVWSRCDCYHYERARRAHCAAALGPDDAAFALTRPSENLTLCVRPFRPSRPERAQHVRSEAAAPRIERRHERVSRRQLLATTS